MLRFARAIVRHPWVTLGLIAAVIAPLLVLATRLVPDNSIAAWFVERDPAVAEYRDFLERYGNDEAILIGFETPHGARDAEELRSQHALAASLREVDGIARVLVGAALPPTVARGLVAEDGASAAIVAWMAVRADLDAVRGRVIDQVDSIATSALSESGRQVRLVGNGVLYEGLNRQTTRDTGIFLTLALVAMVAVLAAVFRDSRAVAYAILPPLLAATAGLGLFVASGRPFTVVGSALPTLVLVIALADTVHALQHHLATRTEFDAPDGTARLDRLAESMAWIAVPCLHTAITTAAGFAALGTSRIALVRDFGLLSAVAVLLAWAIALSTITALLAIADVRPGERSQLPRLGIALGRLARALPTYRTPVIATFVVASLILLAGISQVRADTLAIGMLPGRDRVRQDSDWVERRLGAYTPLEFVLRTRGERPDAAFTAKVEQWRDEIETLEGIERTFTAGDIGFLGAGIAPQYLSADGAELRVTAFVPMTSSGTITRLAGDGEAAGRKVFGDSGSVRATGYLPLYSRITDYVVQSTVWGLGGAFILVFGLFWLLARDWRVVVAAIPSNVLPVILVFGVMGWAGIPLDVGTATVGAIVLGIVVDDTIHVLHRYGHARAGGADAAAAAELTIREAGPSVVLTSIVVGAGFAVMIAASTTVIAYFGLVATLAIIGALIADLLLLPLLLK
jgi:predicted RND superfamily exporter protein